MKKKWVLSLSLISVFTAYVLSQRGILNIDTEETPSSVTAITPEITPISSTAPSPASAPTPEQNPVPAATPLTTQPATASMYKDGTYIGSNEYAYSDYIQVTAIIQGGRLSSVKFPSQASGPNRSRQIYAYAMPQLKSEAISAQSANIDSISGASYTSQAFELSLASALERAKN